MERFIEIGEYVRAVGLANVEVTKGTGQVSFNGFESSTAYLQDLLNPEIYLYRAIRDIFADPDLYSYEEQLVNCLEQLQGLFYMHQDTGRLMHKNLKIESKGKAMEYSTLSRDEQEHITEFIHEQQGSIWRVKSKVEWYQHSRRKK